MHNPSPAPTASGSLVKTPLAHLLVYALERRLTGTFELSLGGESLATMAVSSGYPSKVRTTKPVALLGVVLEELGLITSEQLAASRERMKESPRLQGEILLEMGALDPPRLEAGLREQLARKLDYLFDLSDDTSFAYYDGADPLARFGGAPTPLDPLSILWRCVRQSPRWEHVDTTLRRVGAARLRIAPAAALDRFGFGPHEKEALAAIAQQPTRLLDLTGRLGPSVGQLLAYLLVITKQVELVDGAPAAAAARAPTSSAAARTLAQPPTGQAFARVQLQRQPARAPAVVEEHVIASPDDERTSRPELPTAKQTPVPAAPEAPSDIGSMIAQAVQPSHAPPPAHAVPADAPAPSPGGPTPEERALEAKILARAERISSEDYFQMLGLTPDAPIELVQRTFLDLAKVWHPDRLPAALAEVKDACSKVFSHLTHAHATLTDDAKRQEYATLLKEGGATPDDQTKIASIVEAATEFQKAEFFLKRNLADPKAYAIVKRCAELDPDQADYIALLAWLDAQKPGQSGRDATLRHVASLDRAIQMNEGCERAYFYRGMLYKRLDEPAKAVRDFKKSAELNPRNLDAVREIRIFNMRAGGGKPGPDSRRPGPAAGEPLGGLFGRLFKK